MLVDFVEVGRGRTGNGRDKAVRRQLASFKKDVLLQKSKVDLSALIKTEPLELYKP